MKTTHEIIDETAAYYNLSNRSVSEFTYGGSTCLYRGPNGKQCAFARMCIDPIILKEGIGAINILFENGQDILKPEYRGHPEEFYQDIQLLHDGYNNWTETGLSECGKETIIELKLRWPVKTLQ